MLGPAVAKRQSSGAPAARLRSLLSLHNPVARAARALAGRYMQVCERGDRPNFEPRAQRYAGLATAQQPRRNGHNVRQGKATCQTSKTRVRVRLEIRTERLASRQGARAVRAKLNAVLLA